MLTIWRHSACAISILGTYYRRVVENSHDQSYDLVVFGQWTEAEVIVGFVLSCVPIMPKFFQHVGPKLYATLSRGFRSKEGTSLELNSNVHGDAKIISPSPFNYPQGKSGGIRHSARGLGDSFDPLTAPTGDYITLDDFGDARYKEEARNDGTQVPPSRTAIFHSESVQDGTTMV